jgi:hypothetical protein
VHRRLAVEQHAPPRPAKRPVQTVVPIPKDAQHARSQAAVTDGETLPWLLLAMDTHFGAPLF